MAFTFTASSTGSTLQTGNISIVVSPNSGVLSATNMMPGDTVEAVINVSNTGDVDEYYFVTADWKPSGTTTASLAALLADSLTVSVSASPGSVIYTGKLSGLIDQPPSPGHALTLATGNEDVTFTFHLPDTVGNAVQDTDITLDFVFVATA
ncbi:MAG: hypothetical protein PWP45_197 [Tepidanaerobacteraceae bacterium]|nr:hypothetical protein [Tepidanaerobacteraceae bacterium]